MYARHLLISSLLLAAACSSGVVVDGVDDDDLFLPEMGAPRPDMAPPRPDMATSPPDMATPPPDMSQPPADMSPDMPTDPPDMEVIEGWPALYPTDRDDSPITPSVRENLRLIASKRSDFRDNIFAKIGDSNTVNTGFLACFAGVNVDLGDHASLNPTVTFFRAGDAAGRTPFDRVSLAATIGWSAHSALAGSPNPIQAEISAILPRIALVQFGSNDIQARQIYTYADQMLAITDLLIEEGVIPVLSSIPARLDNADADAWVPRYNATVRAMAQARQIPFVDVHRALSRVPNQGLGPDGLHLNARQGGAGACDLTMGGLMFGHNARNLTNLRMLDKLRASILQGGPAPDPSGAPLAGRGLSADPFVIPSLPFVHSEDTSQGGQRMFSRYTGCNANQNEGGPEFVYRLDLSARTNLRIHVFDQGDTDIDIHLLDSTGQPAGCIARAHQEITRTVDAGTYYIVMDTFVSASGVERSGEFQFIVLAE